MLKKTTVMMGLILAGCASSPISPEDNLVKRAISLCSVGVSTANTAAFDAKLENLLKTGSGVLSASAQSELQGAFLKIDGMTPENFAPLYDKYLGCIDKRMIQFGHNGGQSILIGDGNGNITITQTQ